MSFFVHFFTRTLLKNIILYFWNLSPALSEDVVAHRCSTHFFTVKEVRSPSNHFLFRYGKLPFWLHLLYYLYFALFILRQLVILYLLAFSEDETYSTSAAAALAAYQRYDSSAWVVIRLVGYSHALALLTLLPFPLFALYLHYMFTAKRYNANFRISHSLAFLNKKCFFALNPQLRWRLQLDDPVGSLRRLCRLIGWLANPTGGKELARVRFFAYQGVEGLPYVHYPLTTRVRIQAVFWSLLQQTIHALVVSSFGKLGEGGGGEGELA